MYREMSDFLKSRFWMQLGRARVACVAVWHRHCLILRRKGSLRSLRKVTERVQSSKSAAMRPFGGRMCVAMTCDDMSEADQVGRQLLELNTGCLVTYRRGEDLLRNAPSGQVVLVILATQDEPLQMRRTLSWLRRRWPRCPVTVVGNTGCGGHEMAARESGANFLTRPVAPQQWSSLVRHALDGGRQVRIEGVARSAR